MRTPITAIVMICCLSTSAFAEQDYRIGTAFLPLCQSQPNTDAFRFCEFYVKGYINGVNMVTDDREGNGFICMPEGLTANEAVAAIVRIARTLEGEQRDLIIDANVEVTVGRLLS